MLTLILRTDKPEAEIGLYKDGQRLEFISWQADRQLAETIHQKIKAMLDGHDMDWHNLQSVVVYAGPGSFTGLRIGISVANALTYSLKIPIVATGGNGWIRDGLELLKSGQNQQIVLPKYGAEPHITAPKH